MKRWPLNKAGFWERAPFFRLLLPLVAGILLYASGLSVNAGPALIVLCICTVATLVTGGRGYKHDWVKMVFAIALHLSLLSVGWLLSFHYDIRNNPHRLERHLKAGAYAAIITDRPAEKERSWKLKVKLLRALHGTGAYAVKDEAFVYVYKDDKQALKFAEGDTILLPHQWQAISNSGNPFEFDYAGYCARNNIRYRQFLASKDISLYGKGSVQSLSWTRRVHLWSAAQLAKYIKHQPTLGLMQAMLIGDESGFDEDMRTAYTDTGIIHVVAISGSHITVFFVLVAFLLGFIRHKKYAWLKYIIALPLVWFYVLMSGAPPSAVRAALMFSILAVGFAMNKEGSGINQLLATAFLLLCAQPMWLFSVGFQLSFVAVLSILLFYRPVYKLFTPGSLVVQWLWSPVAMSIAAEILVAPVVVYYFHLFPLMFVVANLAAYMFMGLVLIMGMLIVATSFIPAAASFLAFLAGFLADIFNRIVYGLRGLNPASFHFLHINFTELLLLYMVIAGAALAMRFKNKTALFSALGAACLFAFLLCVDEYNVLRQRRLVVYNIPKAKHIELIEGKFHKVISTDTLVPEAKKEYMLKAAHTGWHAWRNSAERDTSELFVIGDKTNLLLNKPGRWSGTFPVDYLVVNYSARPEEISMMHKTFTPRIIILVPVGTRRSEARLLEAAKEANLPAHSVIGAGAFTVSEI